MDWIASRRQDILNSVSNIVTTAQGYRWNIAQTGLKPVLQASLLATSPANDRAGGFSRSCPNAQLSCRNTSIADTCCLNYPGGQLLLTQFWDTNPTVGPLDSWTIHGLWPNLCNGTYEEYCDKSREYSNITAILAGGGGTDVLSYMQQYWKDYQGDDQDFWSHEWSKHGTCISTLDTNCYDDYKAQEEVVDYFDATVALFKTLPTYETLAAAGVLPSSSRTWTEEEIQAPLKKMHGATVTLGCKDNLFNEVWYHFSVRGPVHTGKYVATEPDGAKSSCPGTGIRYLPKSSSESSSSTTKPTQSQPDGPAPSATSTASPFTGKGFLDVYVKDKAAPQGCLISGGTWYASGTCATFRAQEDVLDQPSATMDDQDEAYVFTLVSSKGPCGIMEDQFQCAKELQAQTIFSTTGNGTLTYQNDTSFYANGIPRNFEKGNIFTVEQTGEAAVEVKVVWSSISSGTETQDEL